MQAGDAATVLELPERSSLGTEIEPLTLSDCVMFEEARGQTIESCSFAEATLPKSNMSASEIYEAALTLQLFAPDSPHGVDSYPDEFHRSGCFHETAKHLTIAPPPLMTRLDPGAMCRGSASQTMVLTGQYLLQWSAESNAPDVLFQLDGDLDLYTEGSSSAARHNVSTDKITLSNCEAVYVHRHEALVESCGTATFELSAADHQSDAKFSLHSISPVPGECSSAPTAGIEFVVLERPVVNSVEPPVLCAPQDHFEITLKGANFAIINGQNGSFNLQGEDLPILQYGGCDIVAFNGPNSVDLCTEVTLLVDPALVVTSVPALATLIVKAPAVLEDCDVTVDDVIVIVPPPSVSSTSSALLCMESSEVAPLSLSGTFYKVSGNESVVDFLNSYTANTSLSSTTTGCNALCFNNGSLCTSASMCSGLDFTIPSSVLRYPEGPEIYPHIQLHADLLSCAPVHNLEGFVAVIPTIHVNVKPSLCNETAPTFPLDWFGDFFLASGCAEEDAGNCSSIPSVTFFDNDLVVKQLAPSQISVDDCRSLNISTPGVSACKEFRTVFIAADTNGLFAPNFTNPAIVGGSTDSCDYVGEYVTKMEVYNVSRLEICQDQAYQLTVNGDRFSFPQVVLVGPDAETTEWLNASEGGATVYGTVGAFTSNTIELNIVADRLVSGYYDVKVTNELDGCTSTATDVLFVHPTVFAFFATPSVLPSSVKIQITLFTAGLIEEIESIEFTNSASMQVVSYTLADVQHEVVPAENFNKLFMTWPADRDSGVWRVEVTTRIGCSVLLNDVLEVVSNEDIDLKAVEPSHVFVNESSALSILRDTTGVAFQDTPRVFLSPDDDPTALSRALTGVSFVSSDEIVGVIANLEPGAYTVLVLNPDNTVGKLDGGLIVRDSQVPRIDSASPTVIDFNVVGTFTVFGDFLPAPANTAVSMECKKAGSTDEFTYTGANFASGDVGKELSFSIDPTASQPIDQKDFVCGIEVTDTSDGAKAIYRNVGIISTNGAFNRPPVETSGLLAIARRGASAVNGRVTQKQKQLFLIGGDNATSGDPSVGNVLDTVESVVVQSFGDVGQFSVQLNRLAVPVSFAASIVISRYIYLIGGYDGTAPVNVVQRALMLSPEDAPEVNVDIQVDPRKENATFAEGVYFYKVAAVFDSNDAFDPDGESIASEPVTIKLPGSIPGLSVIISWSDVPDAVQYRIYRSINAGDALGNIRLLTTLSAANTSFEDENLLGFQDLNKEVILVGTLGRWHVVQGAGSTLQTPRYGHSAATVKNNVGNHVIIIAGGRSATGTGLDSLERFEIAVTAGTEQHERESQQIASGWTLFPAAQYLPAARQFGALMAITSSEFDELSGLQAKLLWIGGVGALTIIELELSSAGAGVGTWQQGVGTDQLANDLGPCSIVGGGFLYYFTGSAGTAFGAGNDVGGDGEGVTDFTTPYTFPGIMVDNGLSSALQGSVKPAPRAYGGCTNESECESKCSSLVNLPRGNFRKCYN